MVYRRYENCKIGGGGSYCFTNISWKTIKFVLGIRDWEIYGYKKECLIYG